MRRMLVERELTEEGPRRGGSGRGSRRTATVNLAESPLCWLHARGHIDDRLFAAGEQLRADYERARLPQSVTMRWDPVRLGRASPHALSPTEGQLAAKQRFDGAMKDAGSGLEDVLWRVVCGGEGLRQAETGLGWPLRSAKLVLRIALERVACFYRIG